MTGLRHALKFAAVCIDTRDGAGRRRLHGVARYAREKAWRMMLVRRRGQEAAREVVKLRPDGIIAYIADGALVEAARRLSVPLVDTAISEVDVPMSLSLDNCEVGRLAAESLVRLGLKHFAYCGVRGKRASEERRTHFGWHLQPWGHELISFSQGVAEGESQMKPLMKWLESLPKPVGVLTFDDKLAERVLTASRWSNLPVPEAVAVLGIGNDDLISKLTWPPLSSVNVPAERIGFEAADILDRAMRSQAIENPRRKIPPTGVTMRGSTELVAVEDWLIESAVRYVRQHAGEAIGVEHVARALGVSRRTLDRRFVTALGRSVHEELTSARMQMACALLSESLETVAQIAGTCGFRSAASFSRAFHRQIGCWPVEYRNRTRG